MARPNEGMKVEAQKGLDWREEFGRGGTRVGAVRARQIVAGENLSDDTIKRMFSFFSRHEVDKEAEGFNSGEEGYPSNGRIAWALWGGDAGFAWSRRLVEQMKKEEETRAVSGKALETIKNKVEEHNEEVGDVKSKRTTVGVLSKVYERGIGAYKTNPASVRPSVSSPEQWAIARINSFLYALRNGRFRSGKHDTDLLPEGHPLSTKNKEDKSMEYKDNRHILNVEETDDTYVISFAKHEDMMESMEDDDKDMLESRPYHDEEDKDEEERLDKSDIVYRTLDLSRASYIDEENRRVRIGVSSEEPVERDFGMEIISHSIEDIDTSFIGSGRSPLLLDHDMKKQIGVVERYEIDSATKSAKAIVRFGRSELAEEIYQDVRDGIRQNISVGYKINGMERMKEMKDDRPMFRVRTTPLEVSVVSIPADSSSEVGVGRSQDKQKQTTIKVNTMTEEVKNEINLDEVREQSVAEAKAEFVRNSKEIMDLAVRHNRRDLADKAIQDGKSVEEFRGILLDQIATDKPLETPEIGMTKKEVRQFSIMKAINALANPTDRQAQRDAEFEFECSEEASKHYGRTAQGIMLPPEVMSNWNTRDLNASDDAGLVGQDFRPESFIDALRNASAVMPLATNLNGLQGDVKIPKKTSAATAAFISAEGGASGESEMVIGSVTMSPKTVGVHTDVTRQLMLQSSLDVENLIRDDLAKSMAIAIDDGALEGSGSSGNPTGITNTSGINTVSLTSAAAPTFAEMVSIETAVAVDNALVGDLAYIINPTNYGTLKTTAKDSGSGLFVAENGQVNGYPVVISNQLTANNYVFGNFNDLLIGFFGGLDITVDPYSNSTSGTVRIVALQSVDVAVRHAVSFCNAS
jgi:HK97 family phage major capsid protein